MECVEPEVIFQVEGDITLDNENVINLDKIKEIIEKEEETAKVENWVKPDDTYYIIFTSGSTGKPKGVQITFDCLNNYLDWSVTLCGEVKENEIFNFGNQAPFSFDLSVMDLYTCLALGGTLHTLTKKMQEDYNVMFNHFEEMCIRDRKYIFRS